MGETLAANQQSREGDAQPCLLKGHLTLKTSMGFHGICDELLEANSKSLWLGDCQESFSRALLNTSRLQRVGPGYCIQGLLRRVSGVSDVVLQLVKGLSLK
jgi:hypothetical protein